jgi:hypothetical protein
MANDPTARTHHAVQPAAVALLERIHLRFPQLAPLGPHSRQGLAVSLHPLALVAAPGKLVRRDLAVACATLHIKKTALLKNRFCCPNATRRQTQRMLQIVQLFKEFFLRTYILYNQKASRSFKQSLFLVKKHILSACDNR